MKTGRSTGFLLRGLEMPLNEKELRRPEFSAGHEVELWDGQMWTLPRPRLVFRPILNDDKSVQAGCFPGFGPEYDDKLDILNGIVDADGLQYVETMFEVLVRLLLANYDLTAEDIQGLIQLDTNDDANVEKWDPIKRAIRGLVPKLPPAIGD